MGEVNVVLLARQLESSEGVAVAVLASAPVARAHPLNAVLEEGPRVFEMLVAPLQGLALEQSTDAKDVLGFVIFSLAARGNPLLQARLQHFPALKEFLDSFRADVVPGGEIVEDVTIGVAAQAADPSREAIRQRCLDGAVTVHPHHNAVVGSQFHAVAAVLQAHHRAFAVRRPDCLSIDLCTPVREERRRQTVDVHPNHDLAF